MHNISSSSFSLTLSAECFQIPTVDWHWPVHNHWTLILFDWLLQFPLVLQEGSSRNPTRETPTYVYGNGLSFKVEVDAHDFGREGILEGLRLLRLECVKPKCPDNNCLTFSPGHRTSPFTSVSHLEHK